MSKLFRWYERGHYRRATTKALLYIGTPTTLGALVKGIHFSAFKSPTTLSADQWLFGGAFVLAALIISFSYISIYSFDQRIDQNKQQSLDQVSKERNHFQRLHQEALKANRQNTLLMSSINDIVTVKSEALLEYIQGRHGTGVSCEDVVHQLTQPEIQIQVNIAKLRECLNSEPMKKNPNQEFRITLMTPFQQDGEYYLQIVRWANKDHAEPISKMDPAFHLAFKKGWGTVAGFAWDKGQMQIVESVRKELWKGKNCGFRALHPNQQEVIQSMIAYPLFDTRPLDGRQTHLVLVGVLNIDTDEEGFFKEDHWDFWKDWISYYALRILFEYRMLTIQTMAGPRERREHVSEN